MSVKESQEVEGKLDECLRALSEALGHKDFELTGNQFIVNEGNKKLVIDLVYEGDRKEGSLDLPMTKVDYEFTGYDDDQVKDFMSHLRMHLQRMGG